MRGSISRSLFSQLAGHAQWEFNDLLDYVWKAPTLTEVLERDERAGLEEFAHEGVRRARWEWESRRLHRVFPNLMANSNLLLAVSLFEYQVLRLTRLALRVSGGQGRPRGIDLLFGLLRSIGIDPDQVALWPQVQAAIKIRNCIAHASGTLAYSGEKTEIRRVVRSKTYLVSEHRRREDPDESYGVELASEAAGETLRVQNRYSWLATAYLRDYVTGLCIAVSDQLHADSEIDWPSRPTLCRRD